MPRFSNKINYETDEVSFYKFVCKDSEVLYTYVGHTTNFASRKSNHKSTCNNSKTNNYNFPLYVFMRDHGGWDNWDMVQIHSRICKDALHARQVENELLEQQQFKLNVHKAYSGVDLPKSHPDYQKFYQKQYCESHHNERIEYGRIYRESNRNVINAKTKATNISLVEQPVTFTKEEMDIYRQVNSYKRKLLRLNK